MVGYIILLLLQFGGLIYCGVRPKVWRWICQFTLQAASIATAAGLVIYYNNLPAPEGSKAPGLVYFSEFISSYLAMWVYGALLIVSLLVIMNQCLEKKQVST